MNIFNEKYYSEYSNNIIRKISREWLKLTPRSRSLFTYVKNLKTGSYILDVGCGIGGNLNLIKTVNKNVETIGIDIGEPDTYIADGSFVKANAYNLPFNSESFDLVIISHVLEHLQYPHVVINEALRVCKDKCIIYVEVPSHRSTLLPFGYNFWDDPTHVRPYTKQSLKKLFELNNIKVIDVGIKKSLLAIVFGIPYMIIGLLIRDKQARSIFPTYFFGLHIYILGKKES